MVEFGCVGAEIKWDTVLWFVVVVVVVVWFLHRKIRLTQLWVELSWVVAKKANGTVKKIIIMDISTDQFVIVFCLSNLILTNICLLTIKPIWHETTFIIKHAILVRNDLSLVRNNKGILIQILGYCSCKSKQKILMNVPHGCPV